MGAKRFKRLADAYDQTGNARVTFKGNIDVLTRADPQLHYVLRLYQPETNSSVKASTWLQKLGDLHASFPEEQARARGKVEDALYDLAVVVRFIQNLAPVISVPSISKKGGQLFVSRCQQLEAEVVQVRHQVDLADFAVPIDNLLEPGMAEEALPKLDEFIVDKTGSKLGFLYPDLVSDCLQNIENHSEHLKANQKTSGGLSQSPLGIKS